MSAPPGSTGRGRRRSRRTRPLAAAAAALVGVVAPMAVPSAADGQEPAPRPPGWVGFWYEVVRRPGRAPVLVVDRVQPGSPAARAGLGSGDTLVAVDGVALTPDVVRALGQGLRAGDPVRLRVRRDGRQRVMEVRAAVRPPDLAVTLSVVTDSAHGVLLAQVDSLRARALLAPAPAAAPRAAAAPPAPGASGSGRVAVRSGEAARPAPVGLEPVLPGGERAQPFHVFVYSAADSLLERLRVLEAEERAARAAEARRLRELAAAVGAGGRVDASDPVLQAERRRLETVRAGSADLRRRIEASARARALEAAAPAAPRFRPLTPYLVGRDRAAGARLTPLNEGLSTYFGVARGLLVVEIAEGTPAEEAGLLPGDVILEVRGAPVSGMDDLREALDRAPTRPVALTVLRQRRTFEARLP